VGLMTGSLAGSLLEASLQDGIADQRLVLLGLNALVPQFIVVRPPERKTG
jgi:hypothetical protein